MVDQQDYLSAEERWELCRLDLNEFTVEDETIPSPSKVETAEAVVLPEIQTMTGYVRQHYEENLVAEVARRIRCGDLCVRYGKKHYRVFPWTGPEDYGEEEDSEPENPDVQNEAGNQCQFRSEDKQYESDCLMYARELVPLGGEITRMTFHREASSFVDADLVLTMKIELDVEGAKIQILERYAVELWLDMDDGMLGELGNIHLYTRQVERSGVKLDEYLVPVFRMDDIEEEAERIILNIVPEGLHDPKYLNGGLFAERLGLKIVSLPLYNRKQTSSILFFGPGEVLTQKDEHEEPVSVSIDADTIVINERTTVTSRDPIFHECFHYLEHKLFFQLQRLHNNDVSRLAKWRAVRVDEGKRSPIEWIEWQVRYGSHCLQVPRSMLKKRMWEELREMEDSSSHMGSKLQLIGRKLAKEFSVYNYQIRNRMIQIGYTAAKGALNFVGDDYIEPFSFSLNECRGSFTFVISPGELFDEYIRNESFREIIDTGKFVYVDGHVCINDPEYVVQRGDKLKLTEWANRHVDQCCLRFIRNYIREQQTHYVYGQLNSDEEYNDRSLTMAASDRAPHLYEQALQTSQTLMSLPGSFHETFAKLMDLKSITVEKLAEETMLSERSITRYRTEERYDYSADTVAILCIGLHLDPMLSMDLLRKAGILLRNTPEDLMVNAVLIGMHRFSVIDVAKYLKESRYPRIKSWPEPQ